MKDDVVPAVVEFGEIELSVYKANPENVTSVMLRLVDGKVPLKIGERFEVEVVRIERTVTER